MKTENVVYIKQNRVLTDSHKLADFFLKDHRHVVRDIEAIMANLPVEFASSNLGVIEDPNIRMAADKLRVPGKKSATYTDSGRVTCVLNSFQCQKLWRKTKGKDLPYAVYNVAEIEAVEKELGGENAKA